MFVCTHAGQIVRTNCLHFGNKSKYSYVSLIKLTGQQFILLSILLLLPFYMASPLHGRPPFYKFLAMHLITTRGNEC